MSEFTFVGVEVNILPIFLWKKKSIKRNAIQKRRKFTFKDIFNLYKIYIVSPFANAKFPITALKIISYNEQTV